MFVLKTLQKMRHDRLSAEIDDSIGKSEVQGALARGHAIESCYTPVIQSGGDFSFRLGNQSSDKILHFSTIVSSIGARFDVCFLFFLTKSDRFRTTVHTCRVPSSCILLLRLRRTTKQHSLLRWPSLLPSSRALRLPKSSQPGCKRFKKRLQISWKSSTSEIWGSSQFFDVKL